MSSFNSVVVVGRVTRDPELRYSASGTPICSFSIATSRRITKASGERVNEITLLDVVAHRRLGEICAQFIMKGREVLVMGTLRQTRWVDPKTKEPQSKLKVVAQQIQFLGRTKPQEDETAKPE